MKKLIYGLVMITTMLCFIACKPEVGDETDSTPPAATSDSGTPDSETPGDDSDSTPPASSDSGNPGSEDPGSKDPGSGTPGSEDPGSGNKEPQVDATTLDGWYVGTRDSAGQKLNVYTVYINDTNLFVYYGVASYKDGEVLFEYDNNLTEEYTIIPDPNNNLSFVDDYEDGWEMTTDSKGTWLRCIDEPEWLGDLQKVTGPEKTGIGVGSVDFYINNDVCLSFMAENENIYLLGNISIYGAMSFYLEKDSETAFHSVANAFSITIDGNTLTVSDSKEDDIPDGDYTLYTRSTPWPTYTAE